jgi:hypothetical protein
VNKIFYYYDLFFYSIKNAIVLDPGVDVIMASKVGASYSYTGHFYISLSPSYNIANIFTAIFISAEDHLNFDQINSLGYFNASYDQQLYLLHDVNYFYIQF